MRTESTEACSESPLLGGRIRFLQPVRGYRTAIDPIFLQAAVPERAARRVLDAGAGSGAAALCLAVRVPGCRILALERDPEMVRLARLNVERNRLGDRIEVVEGDLAEPPPEVRARDFDCVMTNPPFSVPGRGTPPPAGAAARVESMPLDAWLRSCLRRLLPRGYLVVVHRAERIDGLLAGLREACGDLRLFPLWPRKRSFEARRVILRARKAVAMPSRLLHGIVLHDPHGGYTREAREVLVEGRGLVLDPEDGQGRSRNERT